MKTLKQKFDLTTTDIVVYILVLASIGYSLIMLAFSKTLLAEFVREDGPAENLTAIMLFATCIISIVRAREFARQKKHVWVFTAIVLAFFFFFAAGEEISWGQRIFNIKSSEYFLEHNAQGETNLHNMVVGHTKINKLVFSQLMFVVLIFYFLFLEFLAKRVKWIRNLVQYFNVPLPKLHHTVMMLFSAIIIQGIYYPRHDELLECVFAMIFFLIFMRPKKLKLEE